MDVCWRIFGPQHKVLKHQQCKTHDLKSKSLAYLPFKPCFPVPCYHVSQTFSHCSFPFFPLSVIVLKQYLDTGQEKGVEAKQGPGVIDLDEIGKIHLGNRKELGRL